MTYFFNLLYNGCHETVDRHLTKRQDSRVTRTSCALRLVGPKRLRIAILFKFFC